MPRISTALSPARRRVIHAIANMTLDHAPRRSLAEIAQRLNQARQSVHDTVRRLARDGYVWHDTQGWKLTGQGWTAYDDQHTQIHNARSVESHSTEPATT